MSTSPQTSTRAEFLWYLPNTVEPGHRGDTGSVDDGYGSLDYQVDLARRVEDHGWAGAAAEAGIETLGMADCNDPALFVAEEEGKPIVTVPLDDNVPPHLYDPLSAFVTAWD